MSAQTASQQQADELKQSSFFNDFLNDWMRKTRFWEKLQGELFGGPGEGSSFGGTNEGGGGAGANGEGKSKGGDGHTGEENNDSGGSGDEKRKGPRYPRVLLSNFDADPLKLGSTVTCDPRHPLVYQRAQDVSEGIFWINTQAPFAKRIVDSPEYGHESSRWREYMFQRHIDILMKQAIYELNRREGDLVPEVLEERFDRLSQRAYEAAAQDPSLQAFLFDNRVDANTPSDGPAK